MKNNEKILGASFLIFIFLIMILNITTPDNAFSDQENRVLQQLPAFSLKELKDGKYTKDLEKYVSDQFYIRDNWVGIRSYAELLSGKNISGDVYSGRGGYLLQKFNEPDRDELKARVDAINSFTEANSGLKIYFSLVPGSIKVMEDRLPPFAITADQLQYMDKTSQMLAGNINYIDLYKVLSLHRDEYIYYRTDHHWTTKGAYYAYAELANAMGFAPHSMDYYDIKQVTGSFYGSLYSKGGFRNVKPDSIELYMPKGGGECSASYYDKDWNEGPMYFMDNLNKKDKYTVFLGGNHSLLKISSEKPDKGKLLIIRDSYANSLIPFLSDHFSEIYAVDLRYYIEDLEQLIKSENIGNILILYSAAQFFEDSSMVSALGSCI